MNIPKHIFKAYDIRGLIGQEITPELAQNIGKGFVSLMKREKPEGVLTIVVGRDMRESSVEFQKYLTKGIVESGANIKDIGLVSTPAFCFGVGYTGADAGVMVSASHNPAEYNGFKLTRENAVPVSGDTGIQDLAEIIEAIPPLTNGGQRGVHENDSEPSAILLRKGDVSRIDSVPALSAQSELKFAGDHPISKFKIVADSANGMGAQYLDEMFKKIDADVVRMYWEFDGSFPNHEADPMKEENLVDLIEKVKSENADIGIATDGDGDRIFFVDDKGEILPPAILRGLIAQIVLRDNPGATICYDIRPGKITPDMIEEAGGKPVVTRVGHSLIKEKMREVDAVFGGESSGHFFFKFPVAGSEGSPDLRPPFQGGQQGVSDNHKFAVYEGPVTVVIMLLQEMTRQGKALSEIVGPFKRYAHSGEINFDVADKEAALEAIKAKYREGDLVEIDGITITYPDFWFNVRPSNTENKLRFTLEAVDQATMEKMRDEVAGFINSQS
ncbi:MAG: phosphomannomutase/phosphoglucomutase [Patescibacteria group bacterium]